MEKTDDSRVRVACSPAEEAEHRRACLGKVDEPVSLTYCYFCGGHVKHHLQTALDRKVKGTVRTSALAGAGKEPWTLFFGLAD